ncbi:MAG: BON domain-containing protein [Nitrospinae bacterium]|nr:BON domain-containing protein [Nitrospinota bacterium]
MTKWLCGSVTAAAVLLMTGGVANAGDMDSRIESSAKQSYVFKTYLKDDNIVVQSKEGAVTLNGVVEEEFHKSLAEETVAGLPGVTGVTNNLQLKQSPPTASSDAWIKNKVRVALLFHSNVNASATDVEVKGGVVTLRGKANSQAQKELTAEYANDVDGVKRVSNEMSVVTEAPSKKTVGEIIDDASIKAQVKMTLLFHRSTSALHTTVSVMRGVVTVSGEAKNGAEVDLVTKLVTDVYGVTGVVNKMSIK